MPTPLLRGAAAESTELFIPGAISHAILSNLGNSSHLAQAHTTPPGSYGGWQFPVIPAGHPTTIIPVAFPLTRAPTPKPAVAGEYMQLCCVFLAALFIWMLPSLCINKKLCSCCPCFTRWISRRIGAYFMIGLVLNITAISIVIANAPHIEANELFFTMVTLIEKVTDKLEKILMQLSALGALLMLYVFRKKIAQILGYDQAMIRADLRDILTGFSMKRFKVVELSLWHADGLQCGFNSRTLFTRVSLGYNEPAHSRPHDGLREAFTIRERMQLNYDPEDETQKMSIIIKQQEVIGTAVNQMLPAAGAIMGAAAGMASPLGLTGGAVAGAVTGTGAAHSVGAEVARVDLSSAMINRIRDSCNTIAAEAPRPDSERRRLATEATDKGRTVKWSEEFFRKVDLVPQGALWLRIADVEE